MADTCDIFIIGAGIAGMSAAETAAGQKLSVVIAEAEMFGGLAMNVNHLNPPIQGVPESGGDWAADLMTRATDAGAEMLFEPVESVTANGDGSFTVTTASETYRARSVIVASGAKPRRLGIPGETEFAHKGVSYCADCDGPMFSDMPGIVVGAGDSALQEALVLADHCSGVTLVHRGTSLSGRPDLARQVEENAKITIRYNTTVTALRGQDVLEAAELKPSGEDAVWTPCAGLFPFVGLAPETAYLPESVLQDNGLVPVNENLQSNLPGLFAIGAARAGYSGQLKDAAADGVLAAQAICRQFSEA